MAPDFGDAGVAIGILKGRMVVLEASVDNAYEHALPFIGRVEPDAGMYLRYAGRHLRGVIAQTRFLRAVDANHLVHPHKLLKP